MVLQSAKKKSITTVTAMSLTLFWGVAGLISLVALLSIFFVTKALTGIYLMNHSYYKGDAATQMTVAGIVTVGAGFVLLWVCERLHKRIYGPPKKKEPRRVPIDIC